MATMQGKIDGSKIKAFVENEESFSAYVDKKFDGMDTDHDGAVTQRQLKPVVQTLGEAVGLPPMGTSEESDHIYQEVFSEFTKGTTVRKDVFGTVLKDILLGLADGLERDPITMTKMDGTQLRDYTASAQFEINTISVFTRYDVTQTGRLQAGRVLDVLPNISVAEGMPPAADLKMKGLLEDAIRVARVDLGKELDQMQFMDTLRKLLLCLVNVLETNPVIVAHSEKLYDGQNVKKLLKNQQELQKVLDESWTRLPKNRHHETSKDYLHMGVDEVAPAAGLPPIGSVDEIDDVLKQIFQKIDLEDGQSIDQKSFNKCILEILGSLMLQLEGNPIRIKASTIVELDEDPDARKNA